MKKCEKPGFFDVFSPKTMKKTSVLDEFGMVLVLLFLVIRLVLLGLLCFGRHPDEELRIWVKHCVLDGLVTKAM